MINRLESDSQEQNYQGIVVNLKEYNLNKNLRSRLSMINASLVKREKNLKIHLEQLLQDDLITEDEFKYFSVKIELGRMCQDLEEVLEGISVSILFYDEKSNKVFHGACPSIPVEFFDFFKTINELGIISKDVASCGRAIFTGEVVQTDIETSPLWNGLKDHYIENGFRSATSIPFYNKHLKIAGTFALLSRFPNYLLNHDKIQMVQEKTSMYIEEIQRISDRLRRSDWENLSF